MIRVTGSIVSQGSWSTSTFCGLYPRIPCTSTRALHSLLSKSWCPLPTPSEADLLAETGAEMPPPFRPYRPLGQSEEG